MRLHNIENKDSTRIRVTCEYKTHAIPQNKLTCHILTTPIVQCLPQAADAHLVYRHIPVLVGTESASLSQQKPATGSCSQ
jgi:hypothetical protein